MTELFADPVQRGRCTVGALWAELDSGTRRGTAVPRAVLADVAAGVRSAAERAAKQLWPQTGLPEPWWNARCSMPTGVYLGIADCWVDDVAMIWEIESSEWHLSPAAHEYTVRRAAQFTAAGAVYVASKPKMVLNDGAGVTATLRAVYAQAAARPRPPLTARPADGWLHEAFLKRPRPTDGRLRGGGLPADERGEALTDGPSSAGALLSRVARSNATAASMRRAASASPRWSSRSATDSTGRRRVGDAPPRDVRRAAVHRLEHAQAATTSRFPLAANPMPPVTAAARSVRMSPNRLSVTITSKRPGSVTRWIVAASTCW